MLMHGLANVKLKKVVFTDPFLL